MTQQERNQLIATIENAERAQTNTINVSRGENITEIVDELNRLGYATDLDFDGDFDIYIITFYKEA